MKIQERIKELEKEIKEWGKGKNHFNAKNPDEEICLFKSKELGDILCEYCYVGFRIREAELEGIKSAQKMFIEEIDKLDKYNIFNEDDGILIEELKQAILGEEKE